MSDVAANKPSLWNEIQLIEEIGKVVKAYNAISSINTPKISYEAAYPDRVFDLSGQGTLNTTHIICYDIIKKDNGSVSAARFGRDQKIRPYLMEVQTVKLDNGAGTEKLASQQVFMKHYDLVLRFDCMAPSDYESMCLIRDFERMMEIHSMYFERGCRRFIYNGRRPSYFSRDTLYKSRTCEFFAQVEEHWYTITDRIEQIQLQYLGLDRPLLPE